MCSPISTSFADFFSWNHLKVKFVHFSLISAFKISFLTGILDRRV